MTSVIHGNYIDFILIGKSDSGRTLRWDVNSKTEGERIGMIRWLGRWRQYCFFPDAETMFNSICLRDIQVFLQVKNQGHKPKKAEARLKQK